MLNPSEYILQHMDNIMRPVMDIGDRCFYDKAYSRTVASLEQFEKLIKQLYEYKIVSGDRITGNMVVFEVVKVKG